MRLYADEGRFIYVNFTVDGTAIVGVTDLGGVYRWNAFSGDLEFRDRCPNPAAHALEMGVPALIEVLRADEIDAEGAVPQKDADVGLDFVFADVVPAVPGGVW